MVIRKIKVNKRIRTLMETIIRCNQVLICHSINLPQMSTIGQQFERKDTSP